MRRLLATAGAVVLWISATPALAHVEFLTSNPNPGATVTAPQTITLTFSEPPLTLGAAVVLVDSSGVSRSADVSVSGSTLSALWLTGLAAGPISARWRVTADDGHVLEGTLDFTFRPPGGSTATPGEQLGPGSATTTPGVLGPTSAKVDITWWVLGCVLMVTGAALIYLLSGRRP
jgi:methionine-rich copper-binding protein CopC